MGEMLTQAVQTGANGTGRIDYTELGRTVYSAVRDGMSQMDVFMEGRKVGRVVSDWQYNENMAIGR